MHVSCTLTTEKNTVKDYYTWLTFIDFFFKANHRKGERGSLEKKLQRFYVAGQPQLCHYCVPPKHVIPLSKDLRLIGEDARQTHNMFVLRVYPGIRYEQGLLLNCFLRLKKPIILTF